MFGRLWRGLVRASDRLARFVGGLLVILFLLMFMNIGWGHVHYLFQSKPKLADDVAEALHLRANDAFHVRLPLDWPSAIHHQDINHEYSLAPVRGGGGRLFVIFPGLANPTALGDAPELRGRAIGQGWMGDWDAGEIDPEIQLQDEFAGTGVHVANDALLLVPGWRFTLDEYWQMFLGFAAPVILLLLFVGLSGMRKRRGRA